MRVRISRCVVELIQRCAAEAAPREACGLLFGKPGEIDAATIAANVAENPLIHFEIDPGALFAAIRAGRAGGPTVLGYWHSHPSGTATPDGRLWLIVAGETVSGWQAGTNGSHHGRFEPVVLAIG